MESYFVYVLRDDKLDIHQRIDGAIANIIFLEEGGPMIFYYAKSSYEHVCRTSCVKKIAYQSGGDISVATENTTYIFSKIKEE